MLDKATLLLVASRRLSQPAVTNKAVRKDTPNCDEATCVRLVERSFTFPS